MSTPYPPDGSGGQPYAGQPGQPGVPYEGQPGQPYPSQGSQPGAPYQAQPGQPGAPYQGQPGAPVPPGTPVAQPGAGKKKMVSSLVTLGVIAVVIAAALIVPRFTNVEYSKVGQCLAQAKDGYKRVGCDDAGAEYKVTGVAQSTDACIDIPGTTATFSKGSKVLCIGDAQRDPATTINGIQAGECVVFKGDDPYKSGCDTSGAAEVLLVLKDVPKDLTGGGKVVQTCLDKGAADTDTAYAWGIFRAGMGQLGNWDRVLCLGPEKS